jgi:hypothetical protein
LKDQLNNDPGSLKEVFLESLKLESLRYALFTELDVTRDRRASTVLSPMKGRRGGGGDRDADREGVVDVVRVREAVDDHLNIVPDLLRDVHKRLFDNIENMWDLSADAPADLVSTFEVIEMYQEYVDRRAASDAPTSSSTSTTRKKQPTAIGAAGLKDIKSEARKRLKQCLEDKVKSTFKPPQFAPPKKSKTPQKRKGKNGRKGDDDDDDDDEDEDDEDDEDGPAKESEVSVMLSSASMTVRAILTFKVSHDTRMMTSFPLTPADIRVLARRLQNEIAPCMPPDYDAMRVFVVAFERPLSEAVDKVADRAHELDVAEMLQVRAAPFLRTTRHRLSPVGTRLVLNTSRAPCRHAAVCAGGGLVGVLCLPNAGTMPCALPLPHTPFSTSRRVPPPARQVFGFADRPCLKRFEEVCDDLLSEYLHRIKAQVLKWFGNIRRQPLEVVPAADKTLITSQPEDMFNIIHVQVEVAKEKLPLERLKEVVNACLQVTVATTPAERRGDGDAKRSGEALPLISFLPGPLLPCRVTCRSSATCNGKTTTNCRPRGGGWTWRRCARSSTTTNACKKNARNSGTG